MLDGASNNDSMLEHLVLLLESWNIRFDACDRRVTCYAHTIDLVSKSIVTVADDESRGYPVTLACKVVQTIRGSCLRQEDFNGVVKNGNASNLFLDSNDEVIKVQPLQLLRDMSTRWDSCYRLLERLRVMRPLWVTLLRLRFI